jgi:hypothetical protein
MHTEEFFLTELGTPLIKRTIFKKAKLAIVLSNLV